MPDSRSFLTRLATTAQEPWKRLGPESLHSVPEIASMSPGRSRELIRSDACALATRCITCPMPCHLRRVLRSEFLTLQLTERCSIAATLNPVRRSSFTVGPEG